MSLTKQPLKLGDPGLVFAPVAIAAERSLGILSQFISPPEGKTSVASLIKCRKV